MSWQDPCGVEYRAGEKEFQVHHHHKRHRHRHHHNNETQLPVLSSATVDKASQLDNDFKPYLPEEIVLDTPPFLPAQDSNSLWSAHRHLILAAASEVDERREAHRTNAAFNAISGGKEEISADDLREWLEDAGATVPDEEARTMLREAKGHGEEADNGSHNGSTRSPLASPLRAMLSPLWGTETGSTDSGAAGAGLRREEFRRMVRGMLHGGREDWEAMKALSRLQEQKARLSELRREERDIERDLHRAETVIKGEMASLEKERARVKRMEGGAVSEEEVDAVRQEKRKLRRTLRDLEKRQVEHNKVTHKATERLLVLKRHSDPLQQHVEAAEELSKMRCYLALLWTDGAQESILEASAVGGGFCEAAFEVEADWTGCEVVVFAQGGTLLVSPFQPPQQMYGRNSGGGGVFFRHETRGAGTEGVQRMGRALPAYISKTQFRMQGNTERVFFTPHTLTTAGGGAYRKGWAGVWYLRMYGPTTFKACVKYYHDRDDSMSPEMRARIDKSLHSVRIVARSGLLGGARKAKIREILQGGDGSSEGHEAKMQLLRTQTKDRERAVRSVVLAEDGYLLRRLGTPSSSGTPASSARPTPLPSREGKRERRQGAEEGLPTIGST